MFARVHAWLSDWLEMARQFMHICKKICKILHTEKWAFFAVFWDRKLGQFCKDFSCVNFVDVLNVKIWQKSEILNYYTQNMQLTLVNFGCRTLNRCTKAMICAIFSRKIEI